MDMDVLQHRLFLLKKMRIKCFISGKKAGKFIWKRPIPNQIVFGKAQKARILASQFQRLISYPSLSFFCPIADGRAEN